MFRFALAGCGAISRAHIESVRAIDGARLQAVWSRTYERAAAVAAQEGCVAVPTLEALCDRDDVDAVIVCTPSGYHLEPALTAISRGKHVLIEKPLEVSEKRCRAIIDAAAEKGVTVGVIFQSRFAPANQAVYEAVRAGRFGRLVLGSAYVKWHRPQSYYDSGAWRGTWAMDGGGALMNQAIHAVDLLLWLMGPVKSVSGHVATLAHERIEVEDTVTASLQFASGALGSIEATTSVWPGYAKRIEIHGDRGGAVLVDDALHEWYEEGQKVPHREMLARFGPQGASGTASDPMAMSFEWHRRQIEDFIGAVRTGVRPMVDGREGLKAVETVVGVYRSARSREVVHLAS